MGGSQIFLFSLLAQMNGASIDSVQNLSWCAFLVLSIIIAQALFPPAYVLPAAVIVYRLTRQRMDLIPTVEQGARRPAF